MKRLSQITLMICIICFSTLESNGQNADARLGLEISPTINQYDGALGDETWEFGSGTFGLQAGLKYYLSPSFNAAFNLGFGKVNYPSWERNFGDGELMIEYKFNNGSLIKEDATVKPYFTFGLGLERDNVTSSAFFPMGAGLRFRITDNIDLQWKSVYKNRFKDVEYNYLQHNIGFVFSFGSNVPDKSVTAIVQETVAEVIDSDNDGIADDVDACPNTFGQAENKGCPDTDGDGVLDKNDDCPTMAGLKDFSGCPDSDGDGVMDKNDSCPNVVGSVATNGCPDGDKDGVADADDKCPTEAGIADNKGCPEISEEVQEILDLAIEGINFQSGKDIILRSSNPILDKVVQVMKDYPAYNLEISGYTDNTGNVESNLSLSDRRAKQAMQYIVDHGIDAERMTAKGYGIANPIADNGTAAGRAKNRRVELVIVFE